MLISYKSVYYLLFFVFLTKDAVTQKRDWAYFGRRFNRPGDGNGHVPSQLIPGRQGDVKDESDGVLAIPENKDEADVQEDSDGALYIPGKKNEVNKASVENRVINDDDHKTVIDDPDSGFTAIPVEPVKSYQKYHVEKISYTQENIATSWPLGIIPYYFDMTSYDHILASRVREVMDFLEGASCVQFKPLIVHPEEMHNWIHITNPNLERECVHRGMHQGNGEIRMVLGLDCLKRRDILHTLLHAMGFMDEVSHPQRDQNIRVMWENIQPKYQNLYSITGGSSMFVEYDPMSVMHFHDRAFSKNGQATVIPLLPGLQIQPSDKLSQLDKMKLRLAFGHECNRRSVDHLLDTCKTVLHGEAKEPSNKSEEDANGLNKFKSVVKLKYKPEPKSSDEEAQYSQAANDTSGSHKDPETADNEEGQDANETTSTYPDIPATNSSIEKSLETEAANATTDNISPEE